MAGYGAAVNMLYLNKKLYDAETVPELKEGINEVLRLNRKTVARLQQRYRSDIFLMHNGMFFYLF